MKRYLFIGWISFFGTLAFAQEDPVVMRINGEDILRSEFEYSYRHHADKNGAKLSPKEYAELFVQSKLKVDAARNAGLDTTSAFRKQQEAYRARLLDSYLVDGQVMDSCARVLYQQMKANARSGQVQVMQILRYLPQSVTTRRLQEEQERMDSIYRVIQSQPGVDFTRLVEQLSDDKRCLWIEKLQTTPEFEDIAFSLTKGEVSKPFFTPEGLHILKVLDRTELPAYEEIRDSLLTRIRRQPLNGMVELLKKKYRYVPDTDAMEVLLQTGRAETKLFTINGEAYTGAMFDRFASSHPQATKRQLDGFIAKSLLDYENKNIEKEHPELRYQLQEQAENNLIAQVTRLKVDLPALNDRVGLATYFKIHSSDYRWDTPRYKGAVLHCMDKKTSKQAKKLLKKTPENEWVEVLRKTFNASGQERIKVEQGVFAVGDNKYIDKLVFKKGSFEPSMHYPFTVVVGKKQKKPDDYQEVIEQVREDYRNFLYVLWMRDLKDSAQILYLF